MDSTMRDDPEHTTEEGSAIAGETSQTCSTRLIADLPATEDEFGPHKRVAQTLAELFKSSSEDGKTVALEGGWGSGKSTVVGLLRSELEGNDLIKVSLFDAWSHQRDPLRRTFLETLIDSLGGWLRDPDKWVQKREEMSGRVRNTTSKETPRLTRLGIALVVALMFVPIGVAISGFVSAFTLLESRRWLAIASVFLAGLPLILLSIFGLALLVAWPWPWLRRKLEAVLGEGPGHALVLLAGRTVTETESRTYESPDPTSVEFAATFRELMGEVLADNDRRLVLVLDNLDRVDADDALAIWSSMQAFLQQSEHAKPGWLDRLWILVPYDPDGIRRVWQSEADTRKFDEAQGPDKGHEGISRPYDLAEAFLDKTFQVRFEVPPPVLSDWITFLDKLLRQAFRDHDKSEFHDVYRVFDRCLMEEGRSPTPRDLKLYVNGIGSFHRQRHDVPLSHLAYYTVLKRTRSDIGPELVAGQLPGADVEWLFDPSVVRESLAALYFNVDVDRAGQLLLAGPIVEALSSGNTEGLRNLAEVHGDGFYAVFGASVARRQDRWDLPEALANAGKVLEESGLLKQERSEVSAVLTVLRRHTFGILNWGPFDTAVGAGLAALIRLLQPDEAQLSTVFEAISKSGIRSGAVQGVVPNVWGKALLTVLRAASELAVFDANSTRVTVKSDAAGWIGVSDALVDDDPKGEYWRCAKSSASAEEIVTYLTEQVSQGAFTREALSGIKVSLVALPDGPWAGLSTGITQRLQAPNSLEPKETAQLFESLWLLRTVDGSADELLTTLGTQGHAMHHFQEASGDDLAAAWCMFIFIKASPELAQPPEVGSAGAGFSTLQQRLANPTDELVSPFVDLLTRLGELPLLLNMVTANEQSKPFVSECLKMASKGPDVAKLWPPETVVERWSLMEDVLEPDDLDQVIERLSRETKLQTYVEGRDFDPEVAGLYASAVRVGSGDVKQFGGWCVDALRAADSPSWLKQMREEGPLMGLLFALLEVGVDVQLDTAYQDALVDHGKALLDGSQTVSKLVKRWSGLLRALDDNGATMVKERLFDAILGADGKVSAAFIEIYGEELSSESLLRQHSNDAYKLFTAFLKNADESGLRWLVGLVRDNLDTVNDVFSGKPGFLDFRQRLRKRIAEADDEAPDERAKQLAEIARLLDIRATRKKSS